MDDLSLVVTIAFVLGAAIVGGLIARRLGQPVLLGYIVAGALIGPNTPGLVTDRGRVELLANLGVAFLMFALGLELSLSELLRVRRVALLGGLLQIALTMVMGAAIGLAIGWSFAAALLLGGAFAISSSIVAIKLQAGRGEIESAHGRYAFGLGIVQDLSVVPMLALLPILAGRHDDLGVALLRSVGVSALALAGVVVIGTRVAPKMLFALARTGSRELFLMTVVAIALGTGLVSQQAGLSFALGAFMAGIVVSESEFDGQVLAQIIPLRDLFATVFFVSVGMLVDPPFLLEHVGIVLLLVGVLVIGKLLITTGALVLTGIDHRTAALSATVLAQMGEFSFVLAGLGLTLAIITRDQYGLILSVALASILLSSMLLTIMPRILAILDRWALPARDRMLQHLEPEAPPPPLDVVVCGQGRVGMALGQMLDQAGYAYAVVDLNPVVVRRLREHGTRALYGDAGAEPVLARAGIERARILALAIPDLVAASEAVRIARRLNPNVRIIALAAAQGAVQALEASGANEVVQPEFEASLGFGRQVLRWLGVSAPEARLVAAGEREAFYGREPAAESRAARRERRVGLTGEAAAGSATAPGE